MTETHEDAPLLLAARQAFSKAQPATAAPFEIGVGVSGGGDSMALLHLLHRAGHRCHAVTVDHGLRPEAAAEAAQVAGFCATLGVSHDTLRWQGPGETGNLMDQARRARLTLMAQWAKGRGLAHIALGHTADDNAESFLMNLARASGLDGLSGMRPHWQEQGIHWHRPLLGQGREALRAYLRKQGIDWIDDPSNDNDRFTRVKARRALKALHPLGITVARLNETILNLSTAQSALIRAAAQAAEAFEEQVGGLRIAQVTFRDWPEDIRRRLLMAAIRWMGGADYPPRAAQMQHLMQTLDQGRDATLAGLRFRCRKDHITLTREPRAVMAAVPFGQVWDHRWHITGPAAPGMTVAALGPEGLAQCPDWRALAPREALIVSPAIWQGGRLIAAPLARKEADWGATLQPSFGMFILAH